MARVTVEDCIDKVRDRFELVAIAAQRTKNIASGAAVTLDKKGEKSTVVSLREIAAGTVDVDSLREDLVKNYQRQRDMDEDLKQDDVFGSTPMPIPSKLQKLEDEDQVEEFEEEVEVEAALDAAAEEELLKALDEGGYSFDDENVESED